MLKQKNNLATVLSGILLILGLLAAAALVWVFIF
jgi:hypothetical protein